jgi:hypothetical protein
MLVGSNLSGPYQKKIPISFKIIREMKQIFIMSVTVVLENWYRTPRETTIHTIKWKSIKTSVHTFTELGVVCRKIVTTVVQL